MFSDPFRFFRSIFEVRAIKQTAVKENHLYMKAYSRGRKQGAHNIVVYVLKDTHAGLIRRQNPMKVTLNRVGLSVTKKNGGAVTRNRIKRIIREAYRLSDRELNFRRGYIIIIAARESAAGCKMQDIHDDLCYAMKKLDMCCGQTQKNPDA